MARPVYSPLRSWCRETSCSSNRSTRFPRTSALSKSKICGRKKRLWPGLAKLAPPAAEQPSAEELKLRFLTIQALEAARSFEENVVTAPEDADIGAILGWGFAPWTGGPLSYIDTVGAAEFVRTCDRLAQAHGDRFAPTEGLRRMARDGATFYAGVCPAYCDLAHGRPNKTNMTVKHKK